MGTPASVRSRAPRRAAAAGSRAPGPRSKLRRVARPVVVVTLAIGGAVALLLFATVGERVLYNGKVLPGVDVEGVDVAGDTAAEARQSLETLGTKMAETPIVALADGIELSADPRALGFRLDADSTVRAARAAGRSKNPLEAVEGLIIRRFDPVEIPLQIDYDEEAFTGLLDAWAVQLAAGLENGGIRFEGATVIEIAPRSGIGLQRDKAEKVLDAALRDPRREPVSLPVGKAKPPVDSAEVRRAAEEARALLSQPFTIVAGAATMTLTPEQLGSLLGTTVQGRSLVLTLDPTRLSEVLAPQLATIETAPVDATWTVDGPTAAVVPSVAGQSVDLAPVAGKILAGTRRIDAAIAPVEPEHNTAWAQRMNITTQVCSFTTNYQAGAPRVTNIQLAARTLDGSVVEPGQTFSLNDRLGERTPEKGYVKAPAIAGDLSYVEEYGGGVSQVSTTLYNATFFCGYEDVAHSPHSLYISRYPMGREATLYWPSIDNQWRNDSPNGVLIKAWAGESSITISYYSTSDGRTVDAEGPNILEEFEADPPVEYKENPLLPPGEEEKVQDGYTGYLVEVFRVIHRPGQPDERERLLSRYEARATIIERGPALPPPAPAPAPPVP